LKWKNILSPYWLYFSDIDADFDYSLHHLLYIIIR